MQEDRVVTLERSVRSISDVRLWIEEVCKSKRVLNVGASGGVEYYLPNKKSQWLHDRLLKICKSVVGLDIDEESVMFANRHGYSLELCDCSVYTCDERFDVILLSDVIEHLDAPIECLRNLKSMLKKGGVILVTTPNPTHLGTVIKAWLGMATSVYYDHVCAYMPEHIQVSAKRAGLEVKEVLFFSYVDQRNILSRVKSNINRGVGIMLPRLHSSYGVLLTHG